jgi:hypothetical protein
VLLQNIDHCLLTSLALTGLAIGRQRPHEKTIEKAGKSARAYR